ncbi:uncharacterized protein K444DRAFT_390391 [Hyaloscypha bicolor E]|uniref:Uncharacterized protein n=1 Tax=Hyaloscypha bicolor E TaxID=1095630 RepID=A0A2J6TBF0_9HELO|nr:uncharacterized protein K444DRAFT_390391 [Hyaloscypha bicolor E]PMD60313.1 hypothetical protein K444DRAFT_390391 [Hyaloscypha bicolor E]
MISTPSAVSSILHRSLPCNQNPCPVCKATAPEPQSEGLYDELKSPFGKFSEANPDVPSIKRPPAPVLTPQPRARRSRFSTKDPSRFLEPGCTFYKILPAPVLTPQPHTRRSRFSTKDPSRFLEPGCTFYKILPAPVLTPQPHTRRSRFSTKNPSWFLAGWPNTHFLVSVF